MDLQEIAESFGLADVSGVSRMHSGHINSTFCVTCSSGRYVMQNVNKNIFADPKMVMRNISRIETAFRGEEMIAIPDYLSCGGRNYAELDGEIWRIYRYIEECPKSDDRSFVHGYAVGRFLKVVNSREIGLETPVSLHRFDLNLPLRNIHGDTKADNIIFGKKITVIDLDTAMPGYICADYGDMIRSATAKSFDLRVIRQATEGFADGLGGILTTEEIESLCSGIELVIQELAGRYRGGNKNFPDKTEAECLVRKDELTAQLAKFRERRCEIQEIINTCFA